MACPKPVALRQINRCAQYGREFAEMRPEGIAELVDALSLATASAEHAERVISRVLRASPWMPKVSDLYRLADEVPEDLPKQATESNCDFCRGCGFEPTFILSTYVRFPSGDVNEKKSSQTEIEADVYQRLSMEVDGFYQRVDTAVKYCRCPLGQRRRAAVAAKMNEEEFAAHGRKA